MSNSDRQSRRLRGGEVKRASTNLGDSHTSRADAAIDIDDARAHRIEGRAVREGEAPNVQRRPSGCPEGDADGGRVGDAATDGIDATQGEHATGIVDAAGRTGTRAGHVDIVRQGNVIGEIKGSASTHSGTCAKNDLSGAKSVGIVNLDDAREDVGNAGARAVVGRDDQRADVVLLQGVRGCAECERRVNDRCGVGSDVDAHGGGVEVDGAAREGVACAACETEALGAGVRSQADDVCGVAKGPVAGAGQDARRHVNDGTAAAESVAAIGQFHRASTGLGEHDRAGLPAADHARQSQTLHLIGIRGDGHTEGREPATRGQSLIV